MNKLLAVGAIAALLVGLVLLVIDPGHIPLLDANRVVLAETEAQAYCSGIVFLETRGQGGRPEDVADCAQASERGQGYNHPIVIPAFCQGIISTGYQIGYEQCVTILVSSRYWPTADGALSQSWNKRFPYPGDVVTAGVADSESRTGARDSNGRDSIGGYGTP